MGKERIYTAHFSLPSNPDNHIYTLATTLEEARQNIEKYLDKLMDDIRHNPVLGFMRRPAYILVEGHPKHSATQPLSMDCDSGAGPDAYLPLPRKEVSAFSIIYKNSARVSS